MQSKAYSTYFFTFLIGSTLCVIPEGEIQIGPVFSPEIGNRFFGHKHFEALFDKGSHGGLKPLLAKKLLFGVGAVGAGALAVGGAALLAKKFQNHKGEQHYAPSVSSGWGWNSGGGGGDYSQNYIQSKGGVNFPSNDYQYQSDNGQGQEYSSPQYDYSQAFAGAQTQSGYNSYPAVDQSSYNSGGQNSEYNYGGQNSGYNYGGQNSGYNYGGWSR